jgi:hypothetical protein
MGYHRPVSQFNVGKKSEHYSRKHFTECVESNEQFKDRYGASEGDDKKEKTKGL